MNSRTIQSVIFFNLALSTGVAHAQSEPFTTIELNQKPATSSDRYRLGHPFEIIYGPDNKLYISEKVGRILQVDTGTGIRKVLLDIRGQVSLTISRNGAGQATSIGQDGMMGMALHPNFNLGTGQDSIYVAYKHTTGSIRIVRYKYNAGATPTLNGATTLITGIPAGSDHSSGRMIIGGDNKIYYTCGDLGANQFAARCSPVRSQLLPTSAEMLAADYRNYSGKILRLNLDGSVPSDNPMLNSVRSHVYTTGHRNPQGLVWEKTASNGTSYPIMAVSGNLYSSEHGPRTDDEINIISHGKNYGWPFIAGEQDNVNYTYVNWSSASSTNCNNTAYTENAIPPGATILQESAAPASVTTNFQAPMRSLYIQCGSQPLATCNAGGTDWMKFATIAPAGLDYYNVSGGVGIPGWYPSLLIPTLRKGTLYRVQLNSTRDGIVGDTIPYFHSFNRYRDIALSPDGQKIFIITDSTGSTSGPSGASSSTLANRGSILVFNYNGALLSAQTGETTPTKKINNISIYPNPANSVVNIQLPDQARGSFTYQIIDVAGRQATSGRLASNHSAIDLQQMHPGVYFIKVYNRYGGVIKMEKLIIN